MRRKHFLYLPLNHISDNFRKADFVVVYIVSSPEATNLLFTGLFTDTVAAGL